LNTHNEAVKRLSTGRGNVLSIGVRMRELGVKAKRPMPAMLVDDGVIAATTEELAKEAYLDYEESTSDPCTAD
jgi:hypothetical protein